MKSRKQQYNADRNTRHPSLFGGPRARRPKPRNRSLCVEPLEDRCLLSLLVDGYVPGIRAYDANTGAYEGVFAQLSSGSWSPGGLTFSPQGDLYVNDVYSDLVERFNGSTGASVGVFVPPGSGGLQGANLGIAFGPDGNLYLPNGPGNTVLRYNGTTGAFIDTFVAAGSGGLYGPFGLTFGPDGNLYVTSTYSNQVLRYQGPTKSSPGQFMDVFGSGTSVNVPFVPRFGPDGNLYVTEYYGGSVTRFNGTTGAFMDNFVPSGTTLSSPIGVAFAPNGNLFVADQGDGVKQYNGSTGAYVGIFVPSHANGLDQPTCIVFQNIAPVANPLATSGVYLTPVDVDLRTLASDYETPEGNLGFTVGSAVKGTVTLLADGHTARFTPNRLTGGPGTFSYSVTDQPNGGPANTVSAAVTVNYAATPTVSAGLDAGANLVIKDLTYDPGDLLTLSLSGANVLVHDPNNVLMPGSGMTVVDANTLSIPWANITGNIQITAGSGIPDTLTVDFTVGNPVPAAGLQFTGNGTDSKLALVDGSFVTDTYTFTGPNSGSIQLTPAVGLPTNIAYAGLTPLSNTGTPANIQFNLPSATQAVLEDDLVPGNGLSLLHSADGTFEDTTFASPTTSLKIIPGAGINNIDVHGLDSTFSAGLNIAGQSLPVSVVFSGPIAVPNLTVAAASITNTGAANVSVSGNASFSAPSIDLGNQGGDLMNFGTLTFNSGGVVSIAEDSATVLAGTSTADSLALSSTGSITNLASTSLTVTNNASFTGTPITSITLGNQTGDWMAFGSLTFNAGAVSIAEDSATVLSGTSQAHTVAMSSTGSITDADGTTLSVAGNASFSGTSISLGNASLDTMMFFSLTFNSPGAVSIAEDYSVTLSGTSTADSLVLSAPTYSMINAASASLTVTHNASFSGAPITLGNQAGDLMKFGSLTFNSAGAVSIAEDAAMVLSGASTGNGLTLTSAGSLTNVPGASVVNPGTAQLSGTSIDLGNQTGDSMNLGSLAFNSGGAVSISEDAAIVLLGTNAASSLVLSSTGSITVAGAGLTVTNNASFSGTSIAIGSLAGPTVNFGSLTFNSAGAVSIFETSATVLSGTSTADSLLLHSQGSITNLSSAAVTVTNHADFEGQPIDLGNQTGDTMKFGSLSFDSGGAVSIAQDSATVLSGACGVVSLVLSSTGSITNLAGASLPVTNNATFSGASIDLGNQTGDTVNFGTLTFNSPGAVSIVEDSAMVLSGTSQADSLLLGSSGSMTNLASVSLTVTNDARLYAPSLITLGNQTGDTMNFGSLMFASGAAVSIAEDSATALWSTSQANSLALSSTGSITNVANGRLTVVNNASFSGTSIILGNQSGDGMAFGSLTFNSGGAVSIAQDSATVLSGTSTADSLMLSSTGSITNVASANLTVTNNASLSGTSITLGNHTGDSMDFGSLTFNSSGTVSIADDTVLSGTSTANSLVLSSTGSITNVASASLTVTNNASFSAAPITLGNQPGDLMKFGSLTFTSGGAVSIAQDSATVLAGTSTADSLVLNSTGSITNVANASLTVTNNASFSGAPITLGNQAGDLMKFGSLTFTSGGAVSIAQDSATVLAGTSTADSLTLSSTGSITNVASASLTVTNNASFSGAPITLGNQAGDLMKFGSLTFTSGGAVSIAQDSATVLAGTSTADSLTLSSTGSITNVANASLTVTNNASFSGAPITLGNQAGDLMKFGSLTFTSGGAVSIAQDSATVLAGTSTADSLVLNSTGSITNVANASLTVTNNASFSGAPITLGNQAGDLMKFGSLTFTSGGAVSIAQDSATVLAGTSTADSLTLSSTGSITNLANASLTVTNNASFSGAPITLGNQAGDLMKFGSLTFTSGGAVSIAQDSATVLAGTSTADSLVLSSTGSITNLASASLTVTNNASFSGAPITLGNQAGDLMKFGSLTFTSGGAVSIAQDSATVLAGTSTADSLVLSSTGSITNLANASLTVTNNASFSGAPITLGNQAGDLMKFGSLTFTSGGAVSIAQDSATVLSGTSTADSLVLSSTGSITNVASASLTVTNNASLSGAPITLGNQAGDLMKFGSLTFTSGGAVSIAQDSATVLAGTSTADSLTLSSTGSITNVASASLTVTNNASFSGAPITLGNQAGDLMKFGSLTFTSGGAVSIAQDSATVLSGTSVANSLALSSTGSITNVASASLTVTNNACLNGTSINLGNQTGDSMKFGSLTFTSAGTVSISQDTAMLLVGANTAGGSLTLVSAGSITNTASVTVSGASGTAVLTAGTSIFLPSGSVLSAASVTLNVGAANSGSASEIRGRIATAGTEAQVRGGAGADTLSIFLATAQLPIQGVKFDGGGGANTLNVTGDGTGSLSDVFCVTDSTTVRDPLQSNNSGRILHSKQVVYAPTAAPTTDVVIDYASLQDLQINNGLGNNNFVTFHMATATTLMVKVNGGSGKNSLRITASDAVNQQILVGGFGPDATSYADVPYYDYNTQTHVYKLSTDAKWKHLPQRFQMQNVQSLEVDAGKGGDVIENNTSVPSLLLGGAGNDVLVGGDGADAIFGGLATDPTLSSQQRQELFGRGGNDYLLSDYTYNESLLSPSAPTKAIQQVSPTCKNEVLDGGTGTNVAFHVGDLVLNCQTIVGGGGTLTTMEWLKAQLIVFNPNSTQVKAQLAGIVDFLMSTIGNNKQNGTITYRPIFPQCPRV